jgi:hypothetical protein
MATSIAASADGHVQSIKRGYIYSRPNPKSARPHRSHWHQLSGKSKRSFRPRRQKTHYTVMDKSFNNLRRAITYASARSLLLAEEVYVEKERRQETSWMNDSCNWQVDGLVAFKRKNRSVRFYRGFGKL